MRLGFIFILLIFTFSAWSQKITSVRIVGLERTKSDYLKQFIQCSQGGELDSVQLKIDAQQLLNRSMISNVTYEVINSSDSLQIIFQCEETGSLLPVFTFGLVKGNVWVRIGALENNLWGRGHRLLAFYQYNTRHTYFLDYTFSRIWNSNFDINVATTKWSSFEPLYFDEGEVLYLYDNNSYGVLTAYNFNIYQKLSIGATYFEEYYRKDDKSVLFGPDSVSKYKVLGKLIYKINHENYEYFLTNGWSNTLNVQTVKTVNENVPFYIFFNDFKYYKRIGSRSNTALRFRFGLSTNNDTPFAPFTLDSYVNIRGVGNKVDRGTGSIVLNLEYRHTTFERNKIAIQTVAFTDMGSWRLAGGGFDDFIDQNNMKFFSGLGIRGVYKQVYNAILRVDYGINIMDATQHGVVVGVGQYF